MKDFPIPSILQCIHFKAKNPGKQMRYVKDYEFDLYIGGERDMYLDEKYYKITRGSLVFRKPGQTVTCYGDFNAYMLTLDFSHQNPIPPEMYIRGNSTPNQTTCFFDVFDIIPDVFFPYHMDDIVTLYKKIISCSYPNIIDCELQKKYITEFLFLILSDSARYNRELYDITKNKDQYIEKAIHYINMNYKNKIMIDDIARHLSLNKNYLIRLFKKEMSVTPNRYINETRLYHARLMLIQTKLSVQNIAFDCGFGTPAYFGKCFKEYFGKTPVEYRTDYEKNGILQ